jgi:hypothetical protein
LGLVYTRIFTTNCRIDVYDPCHRGTSCITVQLTSSRFLALSVYLKLQSHTAIFQHFLDFLGLFTVPSSPMRVIRSVFPFDHVPYLVRLLSVPTLLLRSFLPQLVSFTDYYRTHIVLFVLRPHDQAWLQISMYSNLLVHKIEFAEKPATACS